MAKGITTTHGIAIGLDVSGRSTEACAINDEGTWVENWRFPTMQKALSNGLSRYPGARVVLEVGCHSPWMSRPASCTVKGIAHRHRYGQVVAIMWCRGCSPHR